MYRLQHVHVDVMCVVCAVVTVHLIRRAVDVLVVERRVYQRVSGATGRVSGAVGIVWQLPQQCGVWVLRSH